MKSILNIGALICIASIAVACAPQDQNLVPETEVFSTLDGPFIPGVHFASSSGQWGPINIEVETNGEIITDVRIDHNELTDLSDIAEAILITQDVIPLYIFQGEPSQEAAISAAIRAFNYALGEEPDLGSAFVPGTYVGFMRPYKGGYGEGETRIIMEFSQDEILSIEIDTHMYTGEEPTPEINSILEAAVLYSQSSSLLDTQHETLQALESFPLTHHNFALAVDFTILIAQTDHRHVTADIEGVAAGAYNLEDGAHFVTVDGRNDTLTVGINVEDGIITRATIIHRDTPGIVDEAVNILVNAILEEQSPDIDIVTGATNTSVAVLEALEILFN